MSANDPKRKFQADELNRAKTLLIVLRIGVFAGPVPPSFPLRLFPPDDAANGPPVPVAGIDRHIEPLALGPFHEIVIVSGHPGPAFPRVQCAGDM